MLIKSLNNTLTRFQNNTYWGDNPLALLKKN